MREAQQLLLAATLTLGERLGQTVIVENRMGAAGMIGAGSEAAQGDVLGILAWTHETPCVNPLEFGEAI
jgi:tripartite-type tricarboxylate transporter receptor subunit TctC